MSDLDRWIPWTNYLKGKLCEGDAAWLTWCGNVQHQPWVWNENGYWEFNGEKLWPHEGVTHILPLQVPDAPEDAK